MGAGTRAPQLFVGTYARGGDGGLYPLYPNADGGWELGEPSPCAPNASFGTYSPRFGLHYLVDEREMGALRVLRREDIWQPLARLPTQGALPCYAALSPDEGWLAVTNYGSGSMVLFRLDADTGLAGDPMVVHENGGHGPVTDRQDAPHAHCAVFSPDGKWLYQTDLGTDEVLAFPFDAQRGPGDRQVAFTAPPGSGPRHLVFHPDKAIAFLVSELASTLTVFDVEQGALAQRQCLSTLPGGFGADSLGGHVAINAAVDRVYVTNRGHDSIATFALDANAHLALLGHTPAGGASPRFFRLLEAERRMLVANEDGNNITVFDIAPDGAPRQCGEVAVPAPAFVFAAS
ncbi:lactonase family protein [Sphingomonas sp. JC676]|uniref:lactonase family protein n=1 Tax=Sphingomonas sp. JC676 TaxID=2768065 RepID=UPI0016585558|nr:lactonase family protein [Sphingomonas sp. JC676]MBC9033853.1 lactonase family protein [Sphingomonas sp. JC676]